MARQTNWTRRQVIRSGATGAAGLALTGVVRSALAAKKPGEKPGADPVQSGDVVRGANERIRVAVAGINGRGASHVGAFAGMKDVEIVYVVDPDMRTWGERIEQAQKESGGRSNPTGVQDIRKVLDDTSIDAISIATPNHWHSLMTIWACQAGKDVYVEKPMSHNLHEGRVAVQAARKYKRIVQHGTQSRSDDGWTKAIAAIHSGKLGKLKISRALCYKDGGKGGSTRGDIGFKPIQQPPSELDFNLWLGPAQTQPYHENLVHYRWHWFWDFGNGDLGNQGVHQMDIARWGIKGGTLPKSVISFGGRLGYYDQGEAASTEMSIMDFGETQLIFETRGLPSDEYRFQADAAGTKTGNVFHLEAGTIVDKKFYPEGSNKPADLPEVEYKMGPGGKEFGNFIAAMRSRKPSDLNAEILEGHYSSALCHLANTSIRVGGKIPFHPRPEVFGDNEAVYDVIERMEAYLAANGVDLEKSGYTLGRKLVVDAESETIVADAQANELLFRNYRKGFAVPESIA